VALSDVSVQPAAAPPPAQAAVAPVKPLPDGEQVVRPQPIPPPDSINIASNVQDMSPAQTQVMEGDALLKSGDVREARKSYEQAWAGGSPAGAFGMARSYDPVVLGSLALKNAQPDKQQALAWYERAATAGHVGAADSIVRLRLKP
jgi:TPR repeat protein